VRRLGFWLLVLPGFIMFGLISVVAVIVRLAFRYRQDMETYEEMKRWEPTVIRLEAENRAYHENQRRLRGHT